MGGLTAARLLQLRGVHVTVLEQHYRPGGFLHRFFRGKHAFDTGFHYCGAVGPGSPLGQVLRHLGVFDRLRFYDLDPDGFDQLVFPGLTYRVPLGWDRHLARLQEVFPSEAEGLERLVVAMRRAVDAYGLYRFRQPDLATVVEAESLPLEQALDQFLDDHRLKALLAGQAVLYGVPPSRAPFGLHSLVTDHVLSGAHAIAGGGDSLALALVRAIRRDGGDVRLRTAAQVIEVAGREATAVIAADGSRVEADLVISNLHPRLTHGLLPEGAVKPAARRRVAETELGSGYVGLYLKVSGSVPAIGRSNLYVHPSWDPEENYRPLEPGRVPVYFASAPSEHEPGEHGQVLMVLPVRWGPFAKFAGSDPDTRPPAYLDLKEALTQTALEALLAQVPSLAGRIVEVEASTPLSTEHFTRSPEGAMYGHLHSVAQMGRSRPAWRTRVRNVLMVGQGVGTPGLLGVALSAYYAVGHVFGMEPLLEELQSA